MVYARDEVGSREYDAVSEASNNIIPLCIPEADDCLGSLEHTILHPSRVFFRSRHETQVLTSRGTSILRSALSDRAGLEEGNSRIPKPVGNWVEWMRGQWRFRGRTTRSWIGVCLVVPYFTRRFDECKWER